MKKPALVVAAALALTACAVQSPAPTTPAPTTAASSALGSATPVASAASAVQPTPAPIRHDLIRTVDIGNLIWKDAITGKALKLDQGILVDGDTRWVMGANEIYADANGDGELDSLAKVMMIKGDATTTYYYIWLWDAAKKTAVQVPDEVAEYQPCGSTFTSAAPDPVQGFTIGERLRDSYDKTTCAEPPAHPFVRTVVVANGFLTQTKPFFAYGGVCDATFNTVTGLAGQQAIHVYPSASAPVVDTTAEVYLPLPNWSNRTWPKGWQQVVWVTPAMRAAGAYYGICGFLWKP